MRQEHGNAASVIGQTMILQAVPVASVVIKNVVVALFRGKFNKKGVHIMFKKNEMGFEGMPGKPEKGVHTCPRCKGTGKNDSGSKCKNCHGTGKSRTS